MLHIPLSANYDVNQVDSQILQEYLNNHSQDAWIQHFGGAQESNLLVTPSGFVIQQYGSVKSQKKIGSLKMSKGTHIWEIIALYDCVCLQVGVRAEAVQGQDKEKEKDYLQQFTASTTRTITVILDIDQGQLNFYLNGNHNQKKTIQIEKNKTYVPLIEFTSIGKAVALNPFAQHPKKNYPQIKCLPLNLFNQQNPANSANFDLVGKLEELILEKEQFKHQLLVGANQIYFQDDKIKLQRIKIGKLEIHQTQFINIFENKPSQPNSLVFIKLSLQQFSCLTKSFQFKRTYEIGQTNQDMIEQFHYYWKNAKVISNQVLVKIPYILMKQIVLSQLEEYEVEFGKIFDLEQENLNSCKLIKIIRALLEIDEQLYAMTISNPQLQSFISKTQFNFVPRIFSQYQRLLTFVDSNNYPEDIITLTQHGLMKLPGFSNQFRHFSNYRFQIETLTNINDIWSIIPREKIFNFIDIPLHLTINNIPYQKTEIQNYQFAKRNNDSIYFTMYNEQGDVEIWNGELSLFKVAKFNLRNLVERIEDFSELFAEPPAPKNESQVNQSVNEGSQDSQSEEAEESIEPNQDYLNQLYAMGFSIEVAKQALIESKNKIEEAIEKVFAIQEQKNKEKQQNQEEVSHPKLKQYWTCKECTLLNQDQKKCQACDAEPPEEAYEKESQAILVEVQLEQPQVQEEDKVQNDTTEKISQAFKKGNIENLVQFDLHQPFKHLLLAHTFVTESKCYLVLNRFVYDTKELSKFFKVNEGELYSLLNNRSYKQRPSMQNFINILNEGENGRFIYETLHPVLMQNQSGKENHILSDQIVLPLEDKLHEIILQKNNLILKGNQIWQCELFKDDVFEPKIIPLEGKLLDEINELSQTETQVPQTEQQDLKRQGQNQETEQFDNLISLTAEEISDLAKLNEHQEVYFSIDTTLTTLTNQAKDNQFASAIIEVDDENTNNTIQINLQGQKQVMKLSLVGYSDVSQDPIIQEIQSIDTLRPQKDNLLPLSLFSHVGSQFNVQQCVSKICFQQSETFSTVYSKPEFIFKHNQGKTMCISKFSVGSPNKFQNTGVPLASGLIFISNNPNDFQFCSKFNQFTKEKYEQWKKERYQSVKPLKPWEPISYFEMGPNEDSVTITLDNPHVGKYILMMTLSAKQADQAKFELNPLSLTYFLAYGAVAKETLYEQLIQSSQAQKLFNDVNIIIDGQQKNKDDCIYREDFYGNFNKFILEIPASLIHNSERLTITLPKANFQFIEINGVKQREINKKLLKKLPNANKIANLMHDVSQYKEFNQKLMLLIQNANASQEQRFSAIRVLCNLFRNIPQFIAICYNDLDIGEFLKLNLLTQVSQEESNVQEILQHFFSIPAFQPNFIRTLKEILNNIFTLSDIIRPAGFMQLMQMLKKYAQQDSKEYFSYILSHLKQISKFINKIDNQPQKKLNEMQIYQMLTEDQLFSDKYFKLSQFQEDNPEIQKNLTDIQKQLEANHKESDQAEIAKNIHQLVIHPKKPLQSIITYQKREHYDEYLIDLLTTCEVNKFFLIFNTPIINCKVVRIALFNGENNQPILDSSLKDWMLHYLTKYAEAHEKSYQKGKLNILSWKVNLQSVRILRMQITYSYAAAVKTKEESTTFPKDLCIIPQFKGQAVKLTGEQEDQLETAVQSELLLTEGNFVYEKDISFPNSLNYKKYTNKGITYLDSANILELKQQYVILQLKEANTIQNTCEIKYQYYRAVLGQKQKELRQKVLQNQSKEQINDLIQICGKLQQELLQDKNSQSINLSKSLDFLYTYAYELITILISTDQICSKWKQDVQLNEHEGLKMAQLIFKTFIQVNQGPITEKCIVLLNILLKNLNLKYWILFTLTQYQKLETDQNILEALKKLHIPICQSIIYIYNELSEKKNYEQADLLISLVSIKVTKEFNSKELTDEQILLKPLGTIKSTSSQDNDVGSVEKLTDECFELTKEKIFATLFSILGLIVSNSTNYRGYESLFLQTCYIFMELQNDQVLQFVTDITNPADPTKSKLFSLLSNLMSLNNSVSILNNFKEVIEVLSTQQTYKLMFYFFSNFLNALVKYANENYQPFQQELDSIRWLNCVSFVVGQLLWLSSMSFHQQGEQKALQRKRSIKQQQTVVTYQDFLERVEESGQIHICNFDTILQMMRFLNEPRKNLKTDETLENSLTYWGLLLNLISKIQIQQIVEYKIFDLLLGIYFKLDQNKQQILQFRFIDMTKSILDHAQSQEFNSNLIKYILQYQGSALIDGLLSIVVMKDRKINGTVFKQLFSETALFLYQNCNVGRHDGAYSCELQLLKKLYFGNKLLSLILKSECQVKVQSLILEIPQYDQIIQKYIHWYALNKSSIAHVTPATEILNNISKNVRLVFELLRTDNALATESLVQLYSFQKQLDIVLQNQSAQLSAVFAFQLVKNTQEIFEELNELWMVSDNIAREIAINSNGFEYLLQKTHNSKSQNGEEQLSDSAEQQIQEEEFATKLTILETNGVKSQNAIKDWQTHKKGAKAKVHVLTLKDDFSEEYILEFQLEKQIDLKQIKIGFLAYSPEYNDRILGVPETVVVEVKSRQSDNLWYPIGVMNLLEDEAYCYYSVKVMALNLWRLSSQGNLDQQIKSLNRLPICFIRFIMKKPQVTFLEQISQLSFKQYNNIQIAVSFISITGYGATIEKQKQIQVIQEKTASRLLSKMCSSKFKNTLNDISNNENTIQQIKHRFNNVIRALQSNESTLSPLFIGLTKYNPFFGDWVLDQILDIQLSWAHAKLAAEIVLQDKNKQLDRLKKFLSFIIQQIKQLNQIIKQQEQFNQLVLLIEALIYTIRISSKQISNGPIQLNITEEDLFNVLQGIEITCQYYQHSNQIIKLLVTLLKLPEPYVLSMQLQQTAILNMTQHLLQSKQIVRLKLLSILVQISDEVVTELIPYVQAIFNSAQDALDKIDNTILLDYFYFLDSSSNVEQLKKLYCQNKYHLIVYDALKVQNPGKTLLKQIDPLSLNHIVHFIGKITLQNSESIKELAGKLILDIHLLSQIVDINYVENVLIPLLNFEEKVDFTIDIWDKENQVFVGDLRKLSSLYVQEEETNDNSGLHELNGFQSKEFSQQYFESLKSAIQKVIKTNSLKKGGKWVKELEISQGGTQFQKTLSALQKGPFLIILYGKNSNSSENCIIGLFSSQKCGNLVSEFQHDYYPGEVYPIPENGEQFGFTYEKDKIYHLLNNDRKAFGVGMEHSNGGSFSFLLERINLTFSDDQEVASVSIGIHDFDLLEQKPEDDYYFDDFWMQKMEIWIYQQPQQVTKNQTQTVSFGHQSLLMKEVNGQSIFGYGILSSPILKEKYVAKQSVYNYLSATPIYSIPGNCNASNILQCVFVQNLHLNEQAIKNQQLIKLNDSLKLCNQKPFPTLVTDGLDFLNQLTSQTRTTLQYHASLQIFDEFQSQDGVKQIILAVQNATKKWQNQELTQIWNQYVSELSAFCSIPQFFSTYLKNKQSMELLFQLLAGTPDQQTSDQKAWKDKEVEAVKFIYDTLSDVFKSNNNQEIRIIAIKDNLIQKILDKIAIVSKEKKRVFQTVIEDEPEIVQQQQPQAQSDKNIDRKQKKKQGVGYGSDQTGQNQKWNTQDYLDKKKIRSEQLKSLLEIIKNFFSYDNWHLNQEFSQQINQMIFESALLSLLEAAFRSGSLLEMSKDYELNLSYLSLTKTLTKHRNLTPLLLKIPQNYVPRQIESIAQLLTNLKNIAQIFLSCLQSNELSEKDQISKQIATIILETDKSVQEAIQKYSEEGSENEEEDAKEHELQEILKLSLSEAYRRLLKDQRFDYVSFKGPNQQYQHYYEKQIAQAPTPTPAKLIRLAQEFADMSNSLPVEHTNSIFVRADKDRVDVIKALVMGASGTPYAHGAYLFDIYFEDQYPNTPPKMNLSTTGGGKIRFNPNLYACGKVCLSLLGTWRGHASENWDPKLSTILQVLVSTQAIIMSEDVYFNEPGFEGEAGSPDGEMKNEGYSNIVRYGNIQYAMIENIKNPPAGFEQIIRKHFYLKKTEIMEEVNKWIQFAETKQALYMGLVGDHNSSWCQVFKKSKTQYLDMLKTAAADLEKALNGLQQPMIKDIAAKKRQPKKVKQVNQQVQVKEINQGILNIDDVDVSYEKGAVQEQILDVTSDQVKDRWSRYIGAMGLEAVKKQANAKVLLSGIGALGVEIAKNIVLSGVGVFAIYDNKVVTKEDLVGQFFLNEQDIGKQRGLACVDKVQQLNNYVRVKLIQTEVQQYITTEKFDIVILTDVYNYQELICWNNLCREFSIKLIIANANGVYGRIINDFGNEFLVIDKNGEEIPDVMIKSISQQGVVELLDGQKSQFEDGDLVMLLKIDGMTKQNESINNQIFKIKTINTKKFQIVDDISEYSPYQSNGIARLIKQKLTLSNKPLEIVLNSDDFYDLNLKMSDCMKLVEQEILHLAYRTISYTEGSLQNFLDQVIKFDKTNYIQKNQEQSKYFEYYLKIFQKIFNLPAFPPMAAFLGGFVSQEVIKALTNKFTPINQVYYFDCVEILPFQMWDKNADPQEQITSIDQYEINQSEELGKLLGEQLYLKLKQSKLFMVGCGAIGCELLKNFAMIDVGIEGNITITDPDHIETSNLNRQFLFRDKHIHKPKSQTAAASVIQMNPKLKNKIIARMDKVSEQSENIFNDQFFEELSIVTNALDNVQARRYVDRRCVKAKIPLLESGTLGTKGHVQCIIPFQTESYNSMQDPVEDGEIPYCTLKMFPEETFHCIEFARDKFNKLFTLKPKLAINIIENSNYNPTNPDEVRQLKSAIKLLKQKPVKFEDCIQWAKNKFQKYFINDIKQLMYTYPPESKTKDGQPFWRLPKRPPKQLNYDIENEIIVQFISTLAQLRAYMYSIQTKSDWRQKENRVEVAKYAVDLTSKEWAPNDQKKKEIEDQVLKTEKKQQQQQQEEETEIIVHDDVPALLESLKELKQTNFKIQPQEFEKDCDINGHIDFIYALGNLRAINYGLDEMDWITVKLKAGRIVPALATTTAVVSGLQVIELVKVLKQCKLEHLKNAFINLAVPIAQLTEPMKAENIKLNEQISITLWDRWDVKLGKDITIQQLFEHLKQKYYLEPVNIFRQSSIVYTPELDKDNQLSNQKLIELLDIKDENHIDLVINFKKDDQILKNVPEVRVFFNE